MSRSAHGGRHEFGQNFLTHQPTIEKIVTLVRKTTGPILEIGAGSGAITRALAHLNRPLTALEIDRRLVATLRQELQNTRVIAVDIMHYKIQVPVVVGNVPFHLTTPILRRLLKTPTWEHAILVVQWEVARKRAGIGGSTMMTAQAAPWFEFHLEGRIPARHFTPSPTVDGGILHITRRVNPLVSPKDRAAFVAFVHSIFTGRGGTLVRIISRATGLHPNVTHRVLQRASVSRNALPRDLTVDQWVALWDMAHET